MRAAVRTVRRARPPGERAARFDVNVLGAGLALLVALAWCTGAVYVVVRGGGTTPIGLAVIDTLHVYVGVASVAFLLAKVWRVGLRARVRGVAGVTVFDRQLSVALGVLYAAVYTTGVLTVLPWATSLRDTLVEAHLIAAVWAAAPTTWHVWRHRARLLSAIRPRRVRARALRVTAAVLVLAPAAGVVRAPRTVSPLAQTGAGPGWRVSGPSVFLDRLRRAPDGTLVAGGAGLYVRRAGASSWRRVGPFDGANVVLGLTLPSSGPTAALVGALDGLYAAPAPAGPYRRLPLPSREVHGIAVDPGDPATIWATSKDGAWLSRDGGRSWSQQNRGIASPRTAWALSWFGGTVYASDVDAVYRWDGDRWVMSTALGDVDRLDAQPAGRLFASSMGQGIEILDASGWHRADGGLVVHSGGEVQGIHAVSVTDDGGRVYAGSMIDGAQVSTDGGSSWSPVWWRLSGQGVVWRVLPVGDSLVAATDRGLVATDRVPLSPPGARWWTALVLVALAAAAAALITGARRSRRPGVAAARPVAPGRHGS